MTGLFYPGSCEPLKKGVHQVALGTAIVIGGYNFIAFCCRREKHLAINVAIAAFVGYLEWGNVQHHSVDADRG